MIRGSITRAWIAAGVVLAIAACSGSATPPAQGGDGGSNGGSNGGSTGGSSGAGSAGPPAVGGGNGFEGTLTTSGLYAATWTVAQGVDANPFNASNNPSLSSDKATFGNIKVELDGSVSFGSGASELGKNGSFTGSGAKVTLDPSGAFVCAFTIDSDLKGSADGAILHMTGGMTVHWHPVGAGDPSCP